MIYQLMYIFSIAFQAFVILIMMILFLDCRWQRRKVFLTAFFLFVLEAYLLGVSEFTLLRLAVSIVLMAGAICIAFKNTLIEKFLFLMLYSNVQIFLEAVFMKVIQYLIPNVDRKTLVTVDTSQDFFGRIQSLPLIRTVGTIFVMILTMLVMSLIYLVLKREKLRIVTKNLIPFIIFAGMQLALEFFVVYLGAWGGNTFVATFLSVELLILFISLLWMLWQIILTVQRSEAETELAECRKKNELDIKYYLEVQKKVTEMGKIHHDFNNKIQIIQLLACKRGEDDLKKADELIKALYTKLESASN